MLRGGKLQTTSGGRGKYRKGLRSGRRTRKEEEEEKKKKEKERKRRKQQQKR